jgi:hypothetical protein
MFKAPALSQEMQLTLNELIAIEKLAEDIITLRHQQVDYDRQRNYNRECLGAFRRGEIKPVSATKVWLTFG